MKRYQTRVPSEYQEITYLSNNYNQYINPNLKGSDLANCEIEIVMKNLSTNTSEYNFNGVYESGKVAQLGLVATSATECRASINFGFSSAISVTNLPIDDYHTIYVSDGFQKVDGVTVGTSSFGTLSNENFLLFARTNIDTSQISICPKMSLKSFTVKKNNQYIRNMIPVKRLSDNVLGMYDIANDVFYTNQGTGTFGAGADVDNWKVKSPPRYETATDVVTSLPVQLFTDGQPVSSYTLKGNTTTSGTPSPSSPITIAGCGDKTANLFNVNRTQSNVFTLDETKWFIGAASQSTVSNNATVSITNNTVEVVSLNAGYGCMFMIPVEPSTWYSISVEVNKISSGSYFGYSFRDTSGNVLYQTTSYASEVTINTYQGTAYLNLCLRFPPADGAVTYSNIMVIKGSTAPSTYIPYGYKISISSNGAALSPIYLSEPLRKSLDGTAFDTLDSTGLVTYNVDEYGQPQTATTETVTVPTITTTGGEVSIDVDTTVKPSEMDITYHGWHEHEPLKRENGAWT